MKKRILKAVIKFGILAGVLSVVANVVAQNHPNPFNHNQTLVRD